MARTSYVRFTIEERYSRDHGDVYAVYVETDRGGYSVPGMDNFSCESEALQALAEVIGHARRSMPREAESA